MGNVQKRRLLGAGAVVAWIIVIAGGIASIWINNREQYGWVFIAVTAAAVVLTLLAWQPWQKPTVMQRSPAEAETRSGSEQALEKLNKTISELNDYATAAFHGKLPPLPPVPQEIVDACRAPAGSRPREVKCKIFGYPVTRTVTPQDDPNRVWRETYKTILDAHLT